MSSLMSTEFNSQNQDVPGPSQALIESAQFDLTGWALREENEIKQTWANGYGDLLSKKLIAGPPRMPSLFRLQSLHDFFHQQAAVNGGAVLSCELIQVKGVSLARCLIKTFPVEAVSVGYVGMLVNVAANHTLTLRLQALEAYGDDARSHAAWGDLQAQYPGYDVTPYWFMDPSQVGLPVARTWADDECWDPIFPQHPLSRVRYELARLIPTLQFSRDIKNAAPYRG